jgi:hypothetical protein
MIYAGSDGVHTQTGLAKSKVHPSGAITSSIINLPKYQIFDRLILNKTEPMGTYINISIIDAQTNISIGNFTALRNSTVDLFALNLQGHTSIRLRADFESNEFDTPILYNWAVTWQPLPELDVSAGGPYIGFEGSPVQLQANCTTQSVLLNYQYRWDLNNDTVFDTQWSTSPQYNNTWPDDFNGTVCVQVLDNYNRTAVGYAQVNISNIPPRVNLTVLSKDLNVSVAVRIAGEKWHDVVVELYENNSLIANGTLVRYPGSPNDQMLSLTTLRVNKSKIYSAILRYTPANDPVNGKPNGATPCWIILNFSNTSEVRLHHTFNVKHPKTYIWEVNLTEKIAFNRFTFQAIAYDPGADDITFYWDFGDGTNTSNFYPNQNQTFPVNITDRVSHAFPGTGTFTVTLIATDDDGGKTLVYIDVDVG